MFLPIVVYGHPILRKISEDITPEYPELEKFIRISSNVGEMKSAATKDVSVSPVSTKTSNAPTVYESAIWTSKDKNTKRSFAVLKPGSSNTNTITWKVFCLQIICLL
jgi:hypothetical protein